MIKEPLLTEAEKSSALWKKLKAHLEERLELNRKKNDGDLTEIQTAKLRGRNSELKHLIDLDNPSPSQQMDAPE
jgi:hypothetical protein